MKEAKPERWLERAKKELETATYLAEGGYFEDAAFHSQQAAEKALKAAYMKKFGELTKTHELVFLGKKVGVPGEVLESCEALNPFFVQTRYPDYAEILSEEDCRETIESAKEVIEWVESTL